jgi:hypothetical protein
METEITDPKLREALEEIEGVLAKRGLAGAICLASSTHAAFRLTMPAWSGIQVDQEKVFVRLKAGDLEHASSSVHLVLSLADLLALQARNANALARLVLQALYDRGWGVTHRPYGGPDGPSGAPQ